MMKPVVHRGEDCWLACGSRQGACDFCGRAGSCCKKQFASSPATCGFGRAGCVDKHCCVFSLQQDGNPEPSPPPPPSPRPPSPLLLPRPPPNSPRPPSVVLRNVPAAGLQGGLTDSRGSPPPPPPSLRPRRGQRSPPPPPTSKSMLFHRLSAGATRRSQPLTITLPGEVIAGITVGATAGCFSRAVRMRVRLLVLSPAERARIPRRPPPCRAAPHEEQQPSSRAWPFSVGQQRQHPRTARHPVRLRRPIHHLASRANEYKGIGIVVVVVIVAPLEGGAPQSSSESELPPPLPPRRLNAR